MVTSCVPCTSPSHISVPEAGVEGDGSGSGSGLGAGCGYTGCGRGTGPGWGVYPRWPFVTLTMMVLRTEVPCPIAISETGKFPGERGVILRLPTGGRLFLGGLAPGNDTLVAFRVDHCRTTVCPAWTTAGVAEKLVMTGGPATGAGTGRGAGPGPGAGTGAGRGA